LDQIKLQKSFSKVIPSWFTGTLDKVETTNEELNYLKDNFRGSLIDRLALAIAVAGRVLNKELTP
jgi:hypothetical protein